MRNLLLVVFFCASPVGAMTLEECVGAALKNNFDLRTAQEQIRQQHGGIVQARANRLPNVGASGSIFSAGTLDRPVGSDESWSASVSVRQPVFSGGADVAGSKRAKLFLKAETERVRTLTNDILFRVRAGFYRVLLAKEQIALQQQGVELLEEELRFEKKRLEAGTVAKVNVLRSEVALANRRTSLIRARNSLRNSLSSLRREIGLKAAEKGDDPLRVEGRIVFSSVTFVLDDALEEARARRPELRRLRILSEAAGKDIKIERSAFYPRLSLVGNYSTRSSEFGIRFPDTSSGWAVGAQASVNLFNGNATVSRIDQAKSRSEAAKIAIERQRLIVDAEIREAHTAFTQSKTLIDTLKDTVTQAEESLQLIRTRFKAGAGTQLDILGGHLDLTQARVNKSAAIFEYSVAVARYQRAIGLFVNP